MELRFRSLFKENMLPDCLQCMTRWDSDRVQADKLTLTSGCWRYRGEGNANIVIALKDEAAIIRLSKNYSGVSWSDHHKKKVERQVVFTKHVFAPLLGRSYVAQVRAVYIAPDQICQLNECLTRIRPRDRLHKELKVPYATSHTDFARILKFSLDDVDYCVEIKPKKGWWSKTTDLSPNLCTYCLNQYLKLKKSKIVSRSNYCPLDLFSGQPSRMVHAVISLLANPQNNLRIFRDGCLAYSDANKDNLQNTFESVINEWMSSCRLQLPGFAAGTGLLNNFVYLICLALLKPQSDSTEEGIQRFFQLKTELENVLGSYPVIDKYCESSIDLDDKCVSVSKTKKNCTSESSELPAGSVLSRILSAQKLEDPDSKFIKKSFRKICSLHSDTRVTKANSQLIGDDFSYEECPSTKCLSSESWLDEIPAGKLLPKELACIQRHLLAATVKDCSIMITFSPISSLRQGWSDTFSGSVLEDLCGCLHSFRVGIVDLDPKPLCAVVKHNSRESKMCTAYYAYTE